MRATTTATLEELAGTWEVMAEMEEAAKPGRRETLRECADLVRMLVSAAAPTGGHSTPTGAAIAGSADAKDAARYRFLRDEWIVWYPAGYNGNKDARFDMLEKSDERNLDTALDAAIAASAAKGEQS